MSALDESALEQARVLLGGCLCHPGFKDRHLTDPDCAWCDFGEDVAAALKEKDAELARMRMELADSRKLLMHLYGKLAGMSLRHPDASRDIAEMAGAIDAAYTAEARLDDTRLMARLRVCVIEQSEPFICEVYGRWTVDALMAIQEELSNPEVDRRAMFSSPDDEGCVWVVPTWNEPQIGDYGRVELEGYWDVSRDDGAGLPTLTAEARGKMEKNAND